MTSFSRRDYWYGLLNNFVYVLGYPVHYVVKLFRKLNIKVLRFITTDLQNGGDLGKTTVCAEYELTDDFSLQIVDGKPTWAETVIEDWTSTGMLITMDEELANQRRVHVIHKPSTRAVLC